LILFAANIVSNRKHVNTACMCHVHVHLDLYLFLTLFESFDFGCRTRSRTVSQVRSLPVIVYMSAVYSQRDLGTIMMSTKSEWGPKCWNDEQRKKWY